MKNIFAIFFFGIVSFSCSTQPTTSTSSNPASTPTSIPFISKAPADLPIYTGTVPGAGQRTVIGTKADDFFRDFFLRLVAAHPEKMISQDLKRLISNGDIILTFEDVGGAGVATDLVEAGGREAPGIYMRVNLRILALGAELQPGRKKDIIFTRWMVTISHEYVHVLQIQELLSTQPTGFIAALSFEERCALTKNNEAEAYAETCRVAKSWGLKKHFEFCDTSEAFAKYVLDGVRTQSNLAACP